MPAIVGPIAINSISGGVVNFGDSFYLSPKSSSKSALGSGAGNTGDFLLLNNAVNATNYIDPDVNDQDMVEWIKAAALQREGCFLVIFSFFVHLIS